MSWTGLSWVDGIRNRNDNGDDSDVDVDDDGAVVAVYSGMPKGFHKMFRIKTSFLMFSSGQNMQNIQYLAYRTVIVLGICQICTSFF